MRFRLIVFLALISFTATALAAGNSVTGVVSSSVAKQPLLNAVVSVNGKNQTTTNLAGEFTLSNVNAGDIIRAKKTDYVGVSAIASNTDEVLNFELAPIWELTSASQIYTDITDEDWYEESVRKLYERQTLSVNGKSIFGAGEKITRGELADLLVRAAGFLPETPNNIGFCDVATDAKYAASIEFMRKHGWVGGYDSRNKKCKTGKDFRADQATNRANALKMILTVFGDLVKVKIANKQCEAIHFSDVKGDSWYADFVAQANCLGFVKGYSNNTFRPGNDINRAEIAVILNKVLESLD
jgi:alpha-amylase